jgi:hypothetical protein
LRRVNIHAGEDQVKRGLVVDLAAGEKNDDDGDARGLPWTPEWFQSNQNKMREPKTAAPPQNGPCMVAGDHKR